MRGDSRSPQRHSVGRQDAAHAGAGAFYRTLQAGGRRLSRDCARARELLAAYRRDEWSSEELTALTEHLGSCAACRQHEAAYRLVGEQIRQLPTIAPPADLRSRVFAAVRLEERRIAPAIARLSREATNPALPVVRALPRPTQRSTRMLPSRFALAAAAVLAISLLAARLIPLLASDGFAGIAASLSGAGQQHHTSPAPAPPVARYAVGSGYVGATSALATGVWLVYSALDASGRSSLIVLDRHSGRRGLLAGPSAAPLAVRALTDQWVIWSSGTGSTSAPWRLSASRLDGTNATPLTLVVSGQSGDDVPATLGGVWAGSDNTVLVAGATAAGTGILLRMDLAASGPTRTVLVRSGQSGHLLADPSAESGAYYWADVWLDGTQGLRGAIWRGDGAGHNAEISDETAFHPVETHGTLVWVEVARDALAGLAATAPARTPDADAQALRLLSGALEARNLASGEQWQIAPRTDVNSVGAAGSLVLWQSDAQTHTYDLAGRAPSAVEQQIRDATVTGATASALAWATGDDTTLAVYTTR